MGKMRVAVIGVGSLGQHHARIYAESPNCDLIAVVDTNPKAAKDIAKRHKTNALNNYEELVGKVDAVSIVVPTFMHHQVATFFLNNDINVLVEKPITVTVNEAHELIALAKKKKLLLQVGHIERFNMAIKRLREIATKPAFIEAHRLGPYNGRILDVGVVLDLMIHDLDIILQLVDSSVESIDAAGVGVYGKHEDIANVRLHFKNGCIANLTASRISPDRLRKINLFQADMFISADYIEQEIEVFRRVMNPYAEEGDPKVQIIRTKEKVRREEPLKLELESFLECLRTKSEPVVKGEHARDALEFAVMITEQIHDRIDNRFKPFFDL